MSQSIDDLLGQLFSGGRFSAPAARGPAPKAAPVTAAELRHQADEMEALNRQIMSDIAELSRQLESDAQTAPPAGGRAARAAAPPSEDPRAAAAAFDGLATALGAEILGQDAFLKDLATAFKRPYVMGAEPNRAKNSILIRGARGTGRHTAVETLTRLLHDRGVLPAGEIGRMDLSLYPSQGEQKLFLQDLYALLHSGAPVLVFDQFHRCHPAFLHSLSDLVQTGRLPLSSRYVLQKGILVDAGTALTADAVGALTLSGQFLVFITELTESKVAESFGAEFLNALGDTAETRPFLTRDLIEIARRQLTAFQQKCLERLDFTVTVSPGEDVPRYFAGRFSDKEGVGGILREIARCYRAFAELRLSQAETRPLSLTLSARGGTLLYDGGAGESPVSALLPEAYTGELDAVRAEIAEVVGLDAVKDYILSLEENVRVQRMREEQGLKTSRPSMHMIFTGNPGTGKTTMARLVGKYLKAIGVLSGGQLVEVTRADLVGRYVGHTAPLTTQVIKSALGGVLFIDEAYSLYRGQDDSFGLEAIDTLVKGIEDHRDDLVVILAGYTKEMAEFLTANSGLSSRFPNNIEFPNYTGEELLRIAQSIAQGKGYRIASDAEAPLETFFATIQELQAKDSGNGRLARNKVEEAILNQSRRILAEGVGELDLLMAGDFELVAPEDV